MLATLTGAAAGFLAGMLALAGTIKIVQPAPAALALRRTFRMPAFGDRQLMPIARCIGLVEVGAAVGGVACSATPLRVVATITAGLFATFVLMTARARARGAACGCWGSLSNGPAGDGELRRRFLFAAAAVAVSAERWIRPAEGPGLPVGLSGALVATCAAAGVRVAVGAVLAVEKNTTEGARFRLSRWISRVGGFGPEVRNHRDQVRGAPRRRLLRSLQRDGAVLSVVTALGPDQRLSWRRAVVTRRSGESEAAAALVSVPGKPGTLRIVAVAGFAVTVIGDTAEPLVLGSGGTVLDRPKRRRPHTIPSGAGVR